MRLKDRVVLITGASRGVGAAVAIACAKEGAHVALAAKTVDPNPRLPGTLGDVAANCATGVPSNQLTVSVTAGGTATASFTVTCQQIVTTGTVAATTTLPEYPHGEIDTAETVDLITVRLENTAATMREVHDQVDDEDPTSADLLHAIIQSLEQYAWMVSAENRTTSAAK